VAIGSTKVLVLDDLHVRAFDLANGAPLWERPLEGNSPLLSSDQALAVSPDGARVAVVAPLNAVRLLDGGTGDEIAWWPWHDVRVDLVWYGQTLYVTRRGDSPSLVAIDDAGHTRWTFADPDRWPSAPALVDDDTVYSLRADTDTDANNDHASEIVAVDRETGKPTWRRALAATRWAALARGAGHTPPVLLLGSGDGVLAFTRAAVPDAPRDLDIEGAVVVAPAERAIVIPASLEGLHVRVGATVVRTDARGAFRAHVSAAPGDAIRVSLEDGITLAPPKDPRAERAPVIADRVSVIVARAAAPGRVELALHEVSPWPPK